MTILALISCQENEQELYKLLESDRTGLKFNNVIGDTEAFNILNLEYLYHGGGVGVGDFNRDGLPDLFFTGNLVSNKLYLNEGSLTFRDVSEAAGIGLSDKWCAGVSVVDINDDGWDDIYVCATFYYSGDKLENALLINQGLNEEGIPQFEDQAAQYGLDDNGNSSQAGFFDYDRDGDLDVYIVTNRLEVLAPNKFLIKRLEGEALSTDRLYRNNGDGTFSNVSKEAGILIEGYGLGLSISDFNMDGWPDIYVSNDYLSNDLLYINQQDGTFKNEISKIFKHQSQSARGNDAVDINGDGLTDIFTVDQLPYYNDRRKRMQSIVPYSKYVNTEKFEYEYQFHRNTLQINQGLHSNGFPLFSDIGMLAGVHASDWSWAPLIQDYNHDGSPDIFISNGYPKDVADMDYMALRQRETVAINKDMIYNQLREVKIPNYYFENNGDGRFSLVSKQVGMKKPSFSYGAVYADLDNDGDLEIVTNNINQPAFLYQNKTNEKEDRNFHFLRIKLIGEKGNPKGIGAKIRLHLTSGKTIYREQFLQRGYLSSVEEIMHFGLGADEPVSVEIEWPDGSFQRIEDVAPDQVIEIRKNPTLNANERDQLTTGEMTFSRSHDRLNILFEHFDNPFVDFNIQPSLPFQLSQSGPSLSVGDINGDGLEDFFLGGSFYNPGTIFLQNADGRFEMSVFDIDQPKTFEDLGSVLFDVDGDGDLDLYVVSGSYENKLDAQYFSDRFYENDGAGNFHRLETALGLDPVSGSCVKAADYDNDGDLDLFVGGRVIPGHYPLPVSSRILRNDTDSGRIQFTDVTREIAPELIDFGLTTDALWTDVDNDFDRDLFIVSEWKEPVVMINENGMFTKVAICEGAEVMKGLWKSLSAGDLDGDGDIDYVLGNFGLNNEYNASPDRPLGIIAADFDQNGSTDPVISSYSLSQSGKYKAYPVHSLDDILKPILTVQKKLLTYEEYSELTTEALFKPFTSENLLEMKVTLLSSVVLENLAGDSPDTDCLNFRIHLLPDEIQYAPVYGTKVFDIDGDGNPDILAVGNDYGAELFTGRQDALNGLWLKGDGNFSFRPHNYVTSGFKVPGDAKSLASIVSDNQFHILAAQNQDSLLSFSWNANGILFTPEKGEVYLHEILENGKKIKKELYYGDGYLSQSSPAMLIFPVTKRIETFDQKGNRIRSITFD